MSALIDLERMMMQLQDAVSQENECMSDNDTMLCQTSPKCIQLGY